MKRIAAFGCFPDSGKIAASTAPIARFDRGCQLLIFKKDCFGPGD